MMVFLSVDLLSRKHLLYGIDFINFLYIKIGEIFSDLEKF